MHGAGADADAVANVCLPGAGDGIEALQLVQWHWYGKEDLWQGEGGLGQVAGPGEGEKPHKERCTTPNF